jgi:hypothetical protein
MNRRSVLSCGAALVVALAGLAAASADAGASRASLTGEAKSRPALSALMPKVVPSGFELLPDAAGDTGPSDLAKAARDDPNAGSRLALSKAKFVRGYQRLWVDKPSGAQNILFLYEFRTNAGALAYLQRELKFRRKDVAARNGFEFSVAAIPDAFGLQAATRPGGTAALVLFTRGPYLVLASANAPSMTDQQAGVSALAEAQFTRL